MTMQEQPLPNIPLVVGVDLGGTQIRTGVLHGAELRSRVALLTGEDTTPEHVIPRIYTAIQQALDEAHVTLSQIAGIGIAAPGPLDNRSGIIFAPPNLRGWDGVPLRNIFEQHFSGLDRGGGILHNLPVFVENDANAAGLGEYMFGAGRGSRHMVYLTISTGIGGGVIVDGKIMEGVQGMAGELGHMTIDWHGERCTCGNIGCLEYLASGTSIARRANEAIADGQGAELVEFARALYDTQQLAPTGETQPVRLNARTVSQAAQAGIPLARAIITGAAEAIGVGLVNIIHIFNPELIILGGGVTQMGAMLMEPALRIVAERAMAMPRAQVRIALAELGANAGLVGAGAVVYYRL